MNLHRAQSRGVTRIAKHDADKFLFTFPGMDLENGDFLILDWPFHVAMQDIRDALAEEGKLDPLERRLGEAVLSSVKTTILGHYRDVDGRIGAAQLVVVSKASEILAGVNALFSQEILSGKEDKDWTRTAARMQEGAKNGEQWVRFDGHSIVMSAPVHLGEWMKMKGELFQDVAKTARKRDDDSEDSLTGLIQFLTVTPMSLIETPERVTLRLGTPSTPTTFRFRLRDTRKTGLDETVLTTIPKNLDDHIVAALLGEEEKKPDRAIQALLDWGPPEEKVRALLGVAAGDDEELRAAAWSKLEAIAAEWNREVGLPEAPATGGVAWEEWCRKVIRFPAE